MLSAPGLLLEQTVKDCQHVHATVLRVLQCCEGEMMIALYQCSCRCAQESMPRAEPHWRLGFRNDAAWCALRTAGYRDQIIIQSAAFKGRP